jgi:L-malate glycosyltransferase
VSAPVPKVSVVMPVHNGERFLSEAVQSILDQTFRDFEFVIIDDGSTDQSAEILERYQQLDARISVYHQSNRGIAQSLNRGCQLAKGELIARMDADDVSLPHRFAKQVSFLDANPTCSVVATRIVLIDYRGNAIGHWPDDMKTTNAAEIRNQLVISNCVAHPTVMMRASIVREYRYVERKLYSEDYELWLRLTSDQKIIDKINEPLLRYRTHRLSLTTISNQTIGPDTKTLRTKLYFIADKLKSKRLTPFDTQVTKRLSFELSRWVASRLFRTQIRLFKAVLPPPLRSAGHVLSPFGPWENDPTGLFFFFPFYHIGGAEKVHTDIVACVADRSPAVFITNPSAGDHFKPLFEKHGKVIDISSFATGRLSRYVLLGMIAKKINRCQRPVVFGSNSPFFYQLIPLLDSHVKCVDLIHAFGGGLEEISFAVVHRLDARVVINQRTIEDYEEQYRSGGVNAELLKRVVLIENKVSIPPQYTEKVARHQLTVLYVGRGSGEKRVQLIARAAERCSELGLPVNFAFVGNVRGAVGASERPNCIFYPETADPRQLDRYYATADLLALTSEREGFPMVIMEAMAHGTVPITTGVGGIPYHVNHGSNGVIIAGDTEEAIVRSLVDTIETLVRDRATLQKLSQNAYQYAVQHFGGKDFEASYRRVLSEKITMRGQ